MATPMREPAPPAEAEPEAVFEVVRVLLQPAAATIASEAVLNRRLRRVNLW
ncbi:MAG: hypothetical protein M0Z51_02085 [Propionibacterium sp.]|nr:hypothetical protein [Propionibacterium sp.]